MKPDLNEAEAARIALDRVWGQLAPLVDEARHHQVEVAERPSLQADPAIDAWVRWLSIFDGELAAVQTVHEAANAGARLTPEEMYTARKTGEKLLSLIRDVPQATGESD